jgi:hypothetical protein
MSMRALSLAIVVTLIAACGGGGSVSQAPAPPAGATAEINLLFMGNSHTSANGLPEMVAAMVRAANAGKSVAAVEAPGWMFLGERATDAPSLRLLREGAWSFVVLQAQEYSSSGAFTYPTDGAEALVRMTREAHAVPILFPEWPRRGIDESGRIYAVHVSIARNEPACIAPIPQAFDLALARHPDLVLHADDGNHSAPAGAFLASLVIATTMTGWATDRIPYLPQFSVDAATQEKLRLVAAQTVATFPPRQWCPAT